METTREKLIFLRRTNRRLRLIVIALFLFETTLWIGFEVYQDETASRPQIAEVAGG